MKHKTGNKPKKQLTVEQQISRRNFIAFGTFTLFGAAAFGGWRWLRNSPLEKHDITGGARQPLRNALNNTEKAFRKFYSNNNLVKTYPKTMAAKNVRRNGTVGLTFSDFKPDAWKLQVKKNDGEILSINLDEIKKLPKTDLVFDFKCIEGWSQISHWSGVRFIDFIEHFGLHQEAHSAYAGFATPNKKYYVGIDMPSMLHPQTLLVYEVNGRPLPPIHGQPLRLIIPVKYGIKSLKRIGSLFFSDTRPPDYWAERGYDYYAGL